MQTFYFGNFGDACPSSSKIIVSIWRKLSCLSACKKSTLVYFSLEIFQRNSKLVFWAIWAWLTKHNMINFKNLYTAKNRFHPSRFPWDIARILQASYLGYFGNGRLRTPKVILSIRRKFWYLFVAKKFNFIPHVFEAIAKICELLTLSTLGMPGYTHTKW